MVVDTSAATALLLDEPESPLRSTDDLTAVGGITHSHRYPRSTRTGGVCEELRGGHAGADERTNGSGCTVTAVTPSVDLRGTLTVGPAEMSPELRFVEIPGATLDLPGSTISAGSASLTCDGELVGALGLSLRFDAGASVQSAVLDTTERTLTLSEPTITLTDVQVVLGGPAGATPPIDLDPITMSVPTLDIGI